MMSAKTVLTETPACPAPTAANNSATAATPGGAPSDFQNLLAGAAPPSVAPSLTDTLPTQPPAQLLGLKQPPAGKLATAPAGTPGAAGQAGKPQAIAPADLLKILSDSATLLPGAGVADGSGLEANSEELSESDEPATADDDILSDWLDVMVPPSVFALQAGSMSGADAKSAAPASGESSLKQGVPLPAIPASLVPQAGLPEREESGNSGAVAVPVAALASHRDAAVAAAAMQNPVAAFAAALKTEVTEIDAPSSDGWMNALGDLTGKRAPEGVLAAEARLPMPVQDSRWADALAHRLVMMARDGESVASLKLVPVDLGPLDIQISVRDGEASVHFGAAHPETRAVLEASMSRLRELLSAQGLQLSNATVSHQSADQNRPERSSTGGAIGAVAGDAEVVSAQVISTSLLDIYA